LPLAFVIYYFGYKYVTHIFVNYWKLLALCVVDF
jgi:hypothetical protein